MIARTKTYLASRTGKLATTYLAIIMSLTIIFSVAIYAMATSAFERPPRPRSDLIGEQRILTEQQTLNQMFRQRAEEARVRILIGLILLDTSVLLMGASFSYYLARKTLEPIEQAMEAQNQFISDASHELRTPLTALQTTNEVALRKKKLRIDDAKELIRHNVTEVKKLHDLSNGLLGIVVQEKADTSKQVVNLQDITATVMTTVAPLALKKNIAIDDHTQSTEVLANRIALNQVVKILVENAIIYSPDNTTISITTSKSNDRVTLNVHDEGIGIAKENHEKIFNRFYRVDQARTKGIATEGSGLGLAIARTVCARQGFELTVTSEVDIGSTFAVTLPIGLLKK